MLTRWAASYMHVALAPLPGRAATTPVLLANYTGPNSIGPVRLGEGKGPAQQLAHTDPTCFDTNAQATAITSRCKAKTGEGDGALVHVGLG